MGLFLLQVFLTALHFVLEFTNIDRGKSWQNQLKTNTSAQIVVAYPPNGRDNAQIANHGTP